MPLFSYFTCYGILLFVFGCIWLLMVCVCVILSLRLAIYCFGVAVSGCWLVLVAFGVCGLLGFGGLC